MTNEQRQWIVIQQDQINQMEKKRSALEQVLKGWQELLGARMPAIIEEELPTLDEAIRELAAGYAKFYAEELATMDEIKRRFEQTKKQLEGGIVIPRTVSPKAS